MTRRLLLLFRLLFRLLFFGTADRLQRRPLLAGQQWRAAGGAIFIGHALETVLGQRVAGEDRQAVAAFLAGDAIEQLAHWLRRTAELVHHIDGRGIGVRLGIARI